VPAVANYVQLAMPEFNFALSARYFVTASETFRFSQHVPGAFGMAITVWRAGSGSDSVSGRLLSSSGEALDWPIIDSAAADLTYVLMFYGAPWVAVGPFAGRHDALVRIADSGTRVAQSHVSFTDYDEEYVFQFRSTARAGPGRCSIWFYTADP
jgi:hypothetical protein